jgi:hypothetical protein
VSAGGAAVGNGLAEQLLLVGAAVLLMWAIVTGGRG